MTGIVKGMEEETASADARAGTHAKNPKNRAKTRILALDDDGRADRGPVIELFRDTFADADAAVADGRTEVVLPFFLATWPFG